MFKIERLERCSQYHLNIDYDRTNCDGYCECYCRCTSIVDICIDSVNYPEVIKKIILKKEYCTIKGYCAERVLRHCGVANPDNWYVGTQGGYYGEEIGEASFEEFDALKNHFNKVLQNKTPQKMMEALLVLEYGWLLEILAKRKWTVQEIPFE